MSNKKEHIIVGDLILDRFVYGHVDRISPEAPTLVLDVDHELDIFGGASNVAAHLGSLGHFCHLLTVVGADFEAVSSSFKASFPERCTTHFFAEQDRLTSIKTRLISIYKRSHLLRYDRESRHDLLHSTEDAILEKFNILIKNAESVLLVDYKKGVVSPRLAKSIIEISRKHNVPVLVDTKCDDLNKFIDSTLIKPNKREFEKILLRHSVEANTSDAVFYLLRNLNIGCIVQTAGEDGIYSYTIEGDKFHTIGQKVEVKELSGAGDSVLAVLSYCLAEGFTLPDSLIYANRIAAKFVSQGAGYTAQVDHMSEPDVILPA